jgi:hypothetical protein
MPLASSAAVTMPACPACHKSYKVSHTACPAGTCPECRVSVQNLSLHRCAVKKVLSLNLVEAWASVRAETRLQCFACGTEHFLQKNVHGFRRFKNVDLCWDCYTIPEITRHVQETRRRLVEHDVRNGKGQCALCGSRLLDPVTLETLQAYERDHLDVFQKTATVWELLVTGASFARVLAENAHCRNLCVRCHSAVTETLTAMLLH